MDNEFTIYLPHKSEYVCPCADSLTVDIKWKRTGDVNEMRRNSEKEGEWKRKKKGWRDRKRKKRDRMGQKM